MSLGQVAAKPLVWLVRAYQARPVPDAARDLPLLPLLLRVCRDRPDAVWPAPGNLAHDPSVGQVQPLVARRCRPRAGPARTARRRRPGRSSHPPRDHHLTHTPGSTVWAHSGSDAGSIEGQHGRLLQQPALPDRASRRVDHVRLPPGVHDARSRPRLGSGVGAVDHRPRHRHARRDDPAVRQADQRLAQDADDPARACRRSRRSTRARPTPSPARR